MSAPSIISTYLLLEVLYAIFRQYVFVPPAVEPVVLNL